MPANVVEVIITAVDEASAKVGGVTNALGGLQTIVQGMLIGAGLTALTEGLHDIISLSMEAEAAQAELVAVLKDTGTTSGVTADLVNELADKYSGLTKFSDDTIVNGMSMLATFRTIGKEVFPEAALAVMDMSQKMGRDLPSSAIILGKALEDPVRGITALRRIGVMFTDDQKETIKGLAESGKTLEAQKLILAEVEREMGGVALAYGTTTPGQIDVFRNQMEKTKETIGSGFLPTIKELTVDIRGMTGELTNNKGEWAALIGQVTAFMATPLGAALQSATENMKAINGVMGSANDLLKSLGLNVKSVHGEFNIWDTILTTIGNTIKTLAGGPLVWFKTALDGLRDVIRDIQGLNITSILSDLHNLGIPGFASGGIVPGPLGAPMLAIVHGGETITPAGVTNNWNYSPTYQGAPASPVQDFQMMRSLAGAW